MANDSRPMKGTVVKVFTERLLNGKRSSEETLFLDGGRRIENIYRASDGRETRCEWRLDQNGFRIDPNVSVVDLADGSRLETHRLTLDNWELKNLPGVLVTTEGAAIAETRYDKHGIPILTRFVAEKGAPVAELRYVYDSEGRLSEAIQSVDGGVRLRFTCRYTAAGELSELAAWFQEQLLNRIVYTYNEHGERAKVVTEEDGTSHTETLEYEYDTHGNWVRQLVHHALGTDEIRRSITYYT